MGAITNRTIKRTSVDLDVGELERAKETLGTRTTRDTINTALRTVNRQAALARAAELIDQGEFEILDPGELTALRHARVEG
jgi:hypothetical protein